MDQKNHLLIVGFVWPEPRSSAAGKRMMQLIAMFRERGWQVTFASSASESKHSADLQSRDIDCVTIEINSSSFDDLVARLDPDMVLFDRFVTEEQFGWRVAEQCPDAVRILDTEDLHCLRRAREKSFSDGSDFSEQDLPATRDSKREIASIYRSDLSLIISEAEVDILEDIFGVGAELLHYLPFLLDPIDEVVKQRWQDFESRSHFVAIGNFQHGPNMDAVKYLKHDIWPRISQQLPGAQLHIYGAYPTPNARQLHKPEEGFYIMGRAENAKEVVAQSKVLLAPLRYGAGLKGKLIEAMQCGTPSVTTDIGAEGIRGDLSWGGKIANEPEEIASAAVALYTDEVAWQKAQQRGIRIINERFTREKFETDFMNRVGRIREKLHSRRLKNFTGQMLMHHTAASSKYMSRWIEEKKRDK